MKIQEGAGHGPSLMPGRSFEAFKKRALRTSSSRWLHQQRWFSLNFVKMVHYGIEHGAMQLIAEAKSRLVSGKTKNFMKSFLEFLD